MERFDDGQEVEHLVANLARASLGIERTVATAESLTGGLLAAAISSGPDAGQWYRGGIVAYHPEVKYSLLGAPRGPVVTASTAAAMARSTARLLGADYSVALTGVGGPGAQDGKPPGTVYLATFGPDDEARLKRFRFEGAPAEVLDRSIRAALRELVARVTCSI